MFFARPELPSEKIIEPFVYFNIAADFPQHPFLSRGRNQQGESAEKFNARQKAVEKSGASGYHICIVSAAAETKMRRGFRNIGKGDVMLESLRAKADAAYRSFSAGLLPGTDKDRILGVRVPDLKALAKATVREGGYGNFLDERHYYTEEVILHGLILGYSGFSGERLAYELEKLLPQIDNWAECDVVAAALKAVRKNSDLFYAKCLEWLNSASAYTVRFAVVILLNYYLDKDFRREVPSLLAAYNCDEYYVNMAIAWYFSVALVKHYEAVIGLFTSNAIQNKWVHNKSVQKAIESYRITSDRKNFLRSLVRR